MIPSIEVESLLRDIAAGDITATEVERSSCNIDRTFKTSNGWTVVIFDDCGQMDYVDQAEAPDGRKADFDTWATEGEDYANPMPSEWRDSHGDNPLGHALAWELQSDYRRTPNPQGKEP